MDYMLFMFLEDEESGGINDFKGFFVGSNDLKIMISNFAKENYMPDEFEEDEVIKIQIFEPATKETYNFSTSMKTYKKFIDEQLDNLFIA